MVGKTKAPTKAERDRMTVLKENVPCIPCLIAARKVRLPSIQHTVSGMRRDGHLSTYSSCEWHHFGHPLESWPSLPGGAGGEKQATMGLLGPSITQGRRTFEEYFGPEELLVRLATELVEEYESAPWFDYNVPYGTRERIIRIWQSEVR